MSEVNTPTFDGPKETTTFKVFTRPDLKKANNLAIKRNYNRSLPPEFIDKLSINTAFPVAMAFTHEHAAGVEVPQHMRCWVVYNEKGDRFFIDTDMEIYDNLQEISVPRHG